MGFLDVLVRIFSGNWAKYLRQFLVDADIGKIIAMNVNKFPINEESIGRLFYENDGKQGVLPHDFSMKNYHAINTDKTRAQEIARDLMEDLETHFDKTKYGARLLKGIQDGNLPNGSTEFLEEFQTNQEKSTWIIGCCEVLENGRYHIFINAVSGVNLTIHQIGAILIQCKQIGYSHKEQRYKFLVDDPSTFQSHRQRVRERGERESGRGEREKVRSVKA